LRKSIVMRKAERGSSTGSMTRKFVHLHVHSPFSFLHAGSSIEDLVAAAAGAGMPALALTDHNNISGAVRFSVCCRHAGIKPIQGAEVTLENGYHLVLLADGPDGYANLCRLLTEAHLLQPRGEPRVTLQGLRRFSGRLFALSGCRKGEIPSLVLRKKFAEARQAAVRYREIFGRRFYLELIEDLCPGSRTVNRHLAELAEDLGLGIVATNNVHYATKEAFSVFDLLTCARTSTRLEDVHPARHLNAEQYLKDAQAMRELFKAYPRAVAATIELADACRPALNPDEPLLPRYPLPEGESAARVLRRLVYEGAARLYGSISRKVTERLEHELNIISQLGYEDYFLIAWDTVKWASEQGIRFAGRGSAADSAVAYCLGITEVDALSRGLLFERFLSLERAEKPDIDIDFDAARRDEVADYVTRRYGKERVAWVATYSTYRARSAVRDIGRVLGMDEALLDRLAKRMPHIAADEIVPALDRFPELRDRAFRSTRCLELYRYCALIAGFPRFPGTHLGGLVISRVPLAQVSPLQRAAKGVVTVQFDKDDVEDLGLMKFDLLSLKTLTAVSEAVSSIRTRVPRFDYRQISLDDAETYKMIRAGETVGVFQLESPAQRALQTRLGAREIEDIVASVALIRPGPIKGNMVEPYIARRHGTQKAAYLHPKLEPILAKTYGVVLFQEQVIAIATAVAGFTPGEADRLRRVMSHRRSWSEMEAIGEEFVAKAVANGVDHPVAEEIFSCIRGYAGYGFCEAHAAAFATTAYKTAYLACHHPAEWFAALLSNQPMGYYSANTLCVMARNRGIAILPPDINVSAEKFTVEQGNIRIPLSRVRGLSSGELAAILAARAQRPFVSLDDFCTRVKVHRDSLVNMILCGAFDRLHRNRRALLARLQAFDRACSSGGLFPGAAEESGGWPDFTPEEKHVFEFEILGIDVRRHLMAYWREKLASRGYLSTADLAHVPAGRIVKLAGLPVRPHRPPTKSGRIVVFVSIEDEFGLADVTVFEDCYRESGWILFAAAAGPVAVQGTVQRRGNGLAVLARHIRRLELTG